MQIPSNTQPASGSITANVNLPEQTTVPQEPKGDIVKLSSHAKAKNLELQGAINAAFAARLDLNNKL
jgi:hypothetical protein